VRRAQIGQRPIKTLLPKDTSYLIKYAIDWAREAEDSRLPPLDLVFKPEVTQQLT
jgi:hypothetical protein